MKNHIIRASKVFLGVICFIIGIIGLLVPILPGWVFIFAGIYLVFPEKGKDIVKWLEDKINSFRIRKNKDQQLEDKK